MRTPIPTLDPPVRFAAWRSMSLNAELSLGLLLIVLVFIGTALASIGLALLLGYVRAWSIVSPMGEDARKAE
jgi:hypothetical protein